MKKKKKKRKEKEEEYGGYMREIIMMKSDIVYIIYIAVYFNFSTFQFHRRSCV